MKAKGVYFFLQKSVSLWKNAYLIANHVLFLGPLPRRPLKSSVIMNELDQLRAEAEQLKNAIRVRVGTTSFLLLIYIFSWRKKTENVANLLNLLKTS